MSTHKVLGLYREHQQKNKKNETEPDRSVKRQTPFPEQTAHNMDWRATQSHTLTQR